MTNTNHHNGVMLNAYPDSIGTKLTDLISMLQMPEFDQTFSHFYVLPTFFNSDLDRGFSIVDYNLNADLVEKNDLETLKNLNIVLKFDIVLNHLSVGSPQFKDLIQNGENSIFKDFFINWNEFWAENGDLNSDGIVIPKQEFLDKLFMRKSGLPILKVAFPDGSERPYWNTFYQKIEQNPLQPTDLKSISDKLNQEQINSICDLINKSINENQDLNQINFGENEFLKDEILKFVQKNRTYLGQMDVNANSPLVWDFYAQVLKQLADYGGKIVRLDAFAYLHKAVGEVNFFNKPGTWDYLERVNQLATAQNLLLLPEIHAEYGAKLHHEVAEKGYMIYDFFLPGLVIHALEKGTYHNLRNWANEILQNGYKTVNMLGCHDGIPVLDLKGKADEKGLLTDDEIDEIVNLILSRGGRVKNLYGADGKKISYYQVNATFFSALGEREDKMLLARAIQLFMPGIPQVWYLDIFGGKNDYAAADQAGADGHKAINRTNLSLQSVAEGLKTTLVAHQLALIRLRNTHPAFQGKVQFLEDEDPSQLQIRWTNGDHYAQLVANLNTFEMDINYTELNN